MVQRPPPQPSGSGPPDSGSRRSSPSHRLSLRLVQNAGIALPSPHGKWRRLLPRAQPPPGTCHKVGVGGRSAPERQQGELLPVVRGIVLVSRGGTRRPAFWAAFLDPQSFSSLTGCARTLGQGGATRGCLPVSSSCVGWGLPFLGVRSASCWGVRLQTWDPPIPPSSCCSLGGQGQRLHQALGPCPTFFLGHHWAVCFEPLLFVELDCGNSTRMFYSETTGIGCGKQRGFPRESGPSCWPLAVYISSATVIPGRDWPAHPL